MDDSNYPNGSDGEAADKGRPDKVVIINLEEEMKKSFIDYSMSVIVSRALPDVRDGLKPVHRRILFAMNEMGLDPSKPHKKSARIVGDTMGKYHPHGDSSIYDAMVRMAQSFSMRYPLVDGHGNFGSLDGDGAAAPRYTEARLSRISSEMLTDIEKETVDFMPNYDEENLEPTVLPSRFPNLLVNGSSGIAVGMAVNIPPHNLGEVIDAVVRIIDDKVNGIEDTDINDLMNIIKGPDFPTSATILGTTGIKQAYRTGRGKILVRAQASIETMPNNREMIIVSEIPYQVNKSRLVEKIGDLVKDKKIDGITDLRDESDRNGIRIVIELKKDANSSVILNQLYKYTQMQESFGVIMLALVNKEPRILNIKQILEYYLLHQKDVVERRTRFELAKALKRAHLLEGYLVALDNIDEVISIIRSSRDTATARGRLVERFSLSEDQSSAIVDMRLRALTGLERERLEAEYAEIQESIKELQAILNDERMLYSVIKEEILIIKTKYSDERRTRIVPYDGDIEDEDLIDDETSVITMTHFDYVKRLPLSTYKSQNRGGKGIIGMQMRDEDIVKNIFIANSHDYLLFFTNHGRVYRKKAYEIPVSGRTSKGTAIVNLLDINGGEKITTIISIDNYNDGEYLLMVTKKGLIKKTALSLYTNIMKSGNKALNIRDDDELVNVLRTTDDNEVFVATGHGMGIRFGINGIRSSGRIASGVRAIRLQQGDYVAGAGVFTEDKILIVSEKGYGKCTDKEEFRLQSRFGKGTRVYKITEKTGNIAEVCPVCEKDQLMLINSEGIVIRIRVSDISTQGRNTQGVKLMDAAEGIKVASVAKIPWDQIDDETEDE